MFVINRYLLIFPDKLSPKYIVLDFSRVLTRNKLIKKIDLDFTLKGMGEFKNGISHSIGSNEQKSSLVASYADEKIEIRQILFNNVDEESKEGFKFPLMIVGIVIALFYNICFRDGNKGKHSKLRAGQRARLNKQLRSLSRSAKR